MAYDITKDEVIAEYKDKNTGLVISVNQYDGGEPKVGITREIETKKGDIKRVRAGRLTIEDMDYFFNVIDEVREDLIAVVAPA